MPVSIDRLSLVAAGAFLVTSAGFAADAHNAGLEWSKVTNDLANEKERVLTDLDMNSRSLFAAVRDLRLQVSPREGVGLVPFVDRQQPSSERLRAACQGISSYSNKFQACEDAGNAISKIPQYESAIAKSRVPELVSLQESAEHRVFWRVVAAVGTAGAAAVSSLVGSLEALYPSGRRTPEEKMSVLRAA